MSFKRDRAAYEGRSKNDAHGSHAKYVLYGTPLPAYDPNARDDGSYVPEWKQEVTDERGRKRFHGAFTGGFSAGYFNTVGSKDGFVPKAFVSSRSSRMKDAAQRAEDFMDEEDLAEHAESQKIETQEAFAGLGSTESQEKTSSKSMFSEVFRVAGETKGHQLLQRMKWRPGQGIGPMVRRRAEGDRSGEMHFFAPKDVSMIEFVKKTDRKGLGYTNDVKLMPILQPKQKPSRKKFGVIIEREAEEGDDAYDMGPRITIGRSLGVEKKKKKTPATADAIKKPHARTTASAVRVRTCHDGRVPLKGFVLALHSRMPTDLTRYAPPEVPNGWQSSRQSRGSSSLSQPYQSTADAAKDSQLDVRGRAAILGEQQLPGKSIFDFMSPEARSRIVAATGNKHLPAARSEALPASAIPTDADRVRTLWDKVPELSRETASGALQRGASGWMPYAEDEAKRMRYKAFLELSAGLHSQLPERSKTSTIDEWAQELREFVATAEVFKPATGLLGSRFTAAVNAPESTVVPDAETDSSGLRRPAAAPAVEEDPAERAAKMGMHGMLTRTRERFYPNRLLCKRFGVRPPPDVGPDDDAQGASTADIPQRLQLVGPASLERMMTEANLQRMQTNASAPTAEGPYSAPGSESGPPRTQLYQPAEVDPARNDALEAPRPDPALFRSIFGSESDDENDT